MSGNCQGEPELPLPKWNLVWGNSPSVTDDAVQEICTKFNCDLVSLFFLLIKKEEEIHAIVNPQQVSRCCQQKECSHAFSCSGFFFPNMGNGIKILEREVERGT